MLSQQQLQAYRDDIQFSTQLCESTLKFTTTWGIFSPREIDEGTQLLLRYIDIYPEDDCLISVVVMVRLV